MALAAAWEIVGKDGLRELTARRIAAQIGYSAGTLYNIFEDLDDLIVQLIGRVHDALYLELRDLPLDDEPEAGVRALTESYIRFTGRYPRLWNLQFEHRLPDGRQPPEENELKVLRLLGLLERTLAPFFGPDQNEQRLHVARVMWSSLHGICSLESAGNLASSGHAFG